MRIILLFLLFVACKERKAPVTPGAPVAPVSQHAMSAIAFAAGGCYGKCPFLAIAIDSSLQYKYYGGQYADKQGYYTGKISRAVWDTINMSWEKIDFKRLDSSYDYTTDDMKVEAFLYYEGKRQWIYGTIHSLPDPVQGVFMRIMDSYKSVKLGRSDSIAFVTRLQYPRGGYMPPASSIKFTPPKVEE
jgi:hypothetical protein